MALKALGVGAVETAKQGSGFDENLLKLKAVATKEKNWGTTAVTTVKNHVLCMAWQDNNTVLLMTTAHWSEEAQKIVPRDPRSRHHIPEDSVQLDSENNQFLSFSRAVVNYNLHMGGVDGNAQQRAHDSPVKHRCQRYWWSVPVSISFRSSCSECLHSLQAQLSYKQNDTCSISEGDGYFADAKSS